MRHGTCPSCGATLVIAEVADTHGLVGVFDSHESALGRGRFSIWDDGIARPVSPQDQVRAYDLHACAGFKQNVYRRPRAAQ